MTKIKYVQNRTTGISCDMDFGLMNISERGLQLF